MNPQQAKEFDNAAIEFMLRFRYDTKCVQVIEKNVYLSGIEQDPGYRDEIGQDFAKFMNDNKLGKYNLIFR